MTAASRYPLSWPDGWPRTPAASRKWAAFKVTFDLAFEHLVSEIGRMNGIYPIVSSDVPVRRDGYFVKDDDLRNPADCGVAVYFEHNGAQKVFACDTFDTVKDNIRAIGLTIESLRKIERYGASQMMERAMQAFTALPPPFDAWQILMVPRSASREDIESAFKRLAFEHHPDRGGSVAKMAELNEARELALKEVG